jgi:hypothetical protein
MSARSGCAYFVTPAFQHKLAARASVGGAADMSKAKDLAGASRSIDILAALRCEVGYGTRE